MTFNAIIYKILRIVRNVLYFFHKPTVLGVRALIIKNKKILLVKHTYVPTWCTPGGGVKPGESTADAVKREVVEEAHIQVLGEPTLMNILYTDIHNRHDYVIFYLCTSFKEHKGHCPYEIQEKKWFPLNKLPDDISPATQRRIDEYLGKITPNGKW